MASPIYEDEMIKSNPNVLKLEESLDKLKLDNPAIGKCIDYLEELSKSQKISMFYVGGFVRDLWLGEKPRDVDIVLFYSFLEEQFKYVTKEYLKGENSFGGLKLNIEGIEVDVWSADKTYAFTKKDSIFFPLNVISNLPKATFFNIDGMVLEVYAPDNKRLFWESDFFDALKNETLEMQIMETIQTSEPWYAKLQIVRAYNFKERFNNWSIGTNLQNYISSWLPKLEIDDLTNLYEKRYGVESDKQVLYAGLLALTVDK